MHVVGLTLSAVAGICFWSGLAVLFGGLALTVMTIKTEGDNNEQ